MLDFRMKTFLQLCQTMNYRKTAELLNTTQPSVTQHIQYIEKEYGCKLFTYDGHTLIKTDKCEQLERKVRAMFYIEKEAREELEKDQEIPIRMGATKTIAEFVLPGAMKRYLKKTSGDFTLIVENTEILLRMLDDIILDFVLLEGYFDKSKYGYQLFRQEPFVGICSTSHPFAGKEIPINHLFSEDLIIREPGSGTRTIFEDVLRNYNHTLEQFKRYICISHFSIIKDFVSEGIGITFAYQAILKPEDRDRLSTFSIKGIPMTREFNYVFLKGTELDNIRSKIDKINLNGN